MKKKIIGNKSNSHKRKYVLPQQGSVNNWEKWEEVSTQVADFISWLTDATNNVKEWRQLIDEITKMINKITS